MKLVEDTVQETQVALYSSGRTKGMIETSCPKSSNDFLDTFKLESQALRILCPVLSILEGLPD